MEVQKLNMEYLYVLYVIRFQDMINGRKEEINGYFIKIMHGMVSMIFISLLPKNAVKETGGSIVEQWNIASWICNICNFRSKTFLDYIPTNIRTVKEDLDLEKHKNDFLNDKLLYNKMDNIILNKKANIYESELKKKMK